MKQPMLPLWTQRGVKSADALERCVRVRQERSVRRVGIDHSIRGNDAPCHQPFDLRRDTRWSGTPPLSCGGKRDPADTGLPSLEDHEEMASSSVPRKTRAVRQREDALDR
jgi:hypothetical protein